jgi:hypothetical protein
MELFILPALAKPEENFPFGILLTVIEGMDNFKFLLKYLIRSYFNSFAFSFPRIRIQQCPVPVLNFNKII